MNASVALDLGPSTQRGAGQDVGVALWVFIAVASMLFALFLAALAMRMDQAPDWTQITPPWQLWLSTGWLVAGSAVLSRASKQPVPDARLLLAGGVFALLFVFTQLWGWQALLDARVKLVGNPAASFFYLLTALHGLHVIGGLVGWAVTLRTPSHWRIALCARYWHFLLVVWLVLFAALGWLTPDIVAFICGRG
jgi:cytochrome c oxidase subunit III